MEIKIEIEFSDRAYQVLDKVLQRLEKYAIIDPRDAATSLYYKVDLITYRSYTLGAFETVTEEMTEWLAKHDKKPQDIVWASCPEIGNKHFVGRIKDVVMSSKEIEGYAVKDSFILNICGHPWYIGSKFGPVSDGGKVC